MATPYTESVAHPARSGGSLVKTLLFFDAMLTPKIITFVYWLALLGAVIGGIGTLFALRITFPTFMTGIGVMIAARWPRGSAASC